MLSYCLKSKKKTECKNPRVVESKNGGIMVLSSCVIFNSNESRFHKEQDARGSLSILGIKTHVSKIPLVSPLLF